MEERIKLSASVSKHFFGSLKTKNSFKALSDELGVSYNTFKKWRSGELTLPKSRFEELTKKLGRGYDFTVLSPAWGQSKGGKKSVKNMSKLAMRKRMEKVRKLRTFRSQGPVPSIKDPGACELYGAMLGDGCLSRYAISTGREVHEVRLVGNITKDYDYMEQTVLPSFVRLFNVKTKIKPKERHSVAVFSTKKKSVFNWFKEQGFPVGKKTKKLSLPDSILNLPRQNLNQVIRGLLDTDGHINSRKDEGFKYPYISITSSSPLMREQIKSILRKQGFAAFIHASSVSVRGKRNFLKWFQLIGSSNPRNLNKYREFMETGRILPGADGVMVTRSPRTAETPGSSPGRSIRRSK